MKLRLSEQYMETLSEVYRKTSVMMVPSSDGKGDELGSTQQVAKILTMYKNIVGNTKGSENMSKTYGNNDKLLEAMADQIDDLKKNQGSGDRKDSNYRYLDDKTLYSSDHWNDINTKDIYKVSLMEYKIKI